MTTPQKTWAYYERKRKALQAYSPRFSRAELCRRAGISDSTMFKGLKAGLSPTARSRRKVDGAFGDEIARLTDDQRAQLDLVLAAEGVMIEAGLR